MEGIGNLSEKLRIFIKNYFLILIFVFILIFIQFIIPMLDPFIGTQLASLNESVKRGWVAIRIRYEISIDSLLGIFFWSIVIVSSVQIFFKIIRTMNRIIDRRLLIHKEGSDPRFTLFHKVVFFDFISVGILLVSILLVEYFETRVTNNRLFSGLNEQRNSEIFYYGLLTSWVIQIVALFSLGLFLINTAEILDHSLRSDKHQDSTLIWSKHFVSLKPRIISFAGILAMLTQNYELGVISVEKFVISDFPIEISDNDLFLSVNPIWMLLTIVWVGIIHVLRIYYSNNIRTSLRGETKTEDGDVDKVTLFELHRSTEYNFGEFTKFFAAVLILFFILQIRLLSDPFVRNTDPQPTIVFDIASVIVSTLIWGTIFLSLAVGLNLTYQILKFPNFAHAEFVTIGAFIAIFMQTIPIFERNEANPGVLREDLLFYSLVIGFVATGLIAVICDLLLFKKLREKASTPETMMIASLGLALFIRGLLLIRFTGSSVFFLPVEADSNAEMVNHRILKKRFRLFLGKNIHDSSYIPPVNSRGDLQFIGVSSYVIQLVVVLNLLVLLLLLIMRFTKLGKAMRAVADDPSLAAASGINVERIRVVSWFIGGGLAGAAGVYWSGLFLITPQTGSFFLLAAFAVIVLGTVGSIEGAVIAAAIIGFVRAVSSPIFAGLSTAVDRPALTTYETITPFIVLIFVLLFNPEGIGQKIEERRLKKAREKYQDESDIFVGGMV